MIKTNQLRKTRRGRDKNEEVSLPCDTSMLPRAPAFDTLLPSMPVFVPMLEDDHRKTILLGSLGRGELFCLREASSTVVGYYLHKQESDIHFIKVISMDQANKQISSQEVAKWVIKSGGNACLLLPGFPKTLDRDHLILGYRFIPSRFAEATTADMEDIGGSLASLHASLKMIPNTRSIITQTGKRVQMLSHRFHSVVSSQRSFGPRPELMRSIFENEISLFKLLEDSPERQPLHGDLVYANVVFPLGGGRLVFLDFEDTCISWFPIDLDIASAIQRFVMLLASDDTDALRLAQVMLRKYGDVCGKKRFLSYAPRDCMRLLAIRSLITLSEMESSGRDIGRYEWEKFFTLYRTASESHLLLYKLEAEFRK